MSTYVTSDWHLGERRMDILQRPFVSPLKLFQAIRDNINHVVNPDDELIVLGDACVSPGWLSPINQINGRKTLIRGNHDRRFHDEDLAPYFDRIIAEGDGLALEITDGINPIDLWLTHYPTQSVEDRFNLVGHIHSSWKVQKNMLNVGVDVHHFRPISLETVPFFFNAICDYYDDDVWVADHPANQAWDSRGIKRSYLVVPS